MADTTFVDYTTPAVDAAWLNDVNDFVYNYTDNTTSVIPYGVVGDGITDDTSAFTSAIASGLNLDLNKLTIRITSRITFNQDNQRVFNGTLLFDGANTTSLAKVTADDVLFERMIFDGNLLQPKAALIYVEEDTQRVKFSKCVFKDILGVAYGSNVLNQTCALNINPYNVTFDVEDCLFWNLRKYNDGTYTSPTLGYGFIGGIYFLPEDFSDPAAAQPTPTNGSINGSTFHTIQTILDVGLSDNDVAQYDDADAIRTYEGTGAKKLNVHVSDCTFVNVSKRALKFRASGGVGTNLVVYADGNAYGMSSVIDLVHNCVVDGLQCYTSSSLPVLKVVQFGCGGDATNQAAIARNITVNYCKVGVELVTLASTPLENFVAEAIDLPSCSVAGVVESYGGVATTQKNLQVKRVTIQGSGNNCSGLSLSLGVDNTGGWIVRDVALINSDWKIEGINNDVDGLTTTITTTAFAGSTTTRAVGEFGSGKGLGGFNRARGLVFNLAGINTSYLSATRPYLIYAGSDNMRIDASRIVVPEGLGTTYPHFEGFGDDSIVDDMDYTGAGFLRMGHLVASSRWAVRSAVRRGNGACSQSFWTLDVASQYYEFEGITDFRPTTATTIVSATATNGIATNIKTRSSNGTPTVSGVAKTANLNTF